MDARARHTDGYGKGLFEKATARSDLSFSHCSEDYEDLNLTKGQIRRTLQLATYHNAVSNYDTS